MAPASGLSRIGYSIGLSLLATDAVLSSTWAHSEEHYTNFICRWRIRHDADLQRRRKCSVG